jgi:hypothetical protein
MTTSHPRSGLSAQPRCWTNLYDDCIKAQDPIKA